MGKLMLNSVCYTGDSAPHNYSTTEQVVGTWIDGSTLYEKTIHTNPTGNTSDYTNIEAIANIDKVISSQFTAKRVESNNTWYYTGNGSIYPESLAYSQYKLGVRVSQGYVQYYVAGYGNQITDLWATIRYTKAST